jgi:hypothetical protein
MAKLCATCGRPRHDGLCDMVTLSDGRNVHRYRIMPGGDLHDQLDENLRVTNVWRKSFFDDGVSTTDEDVDNAAITVEQFKKFLQERNQIDRPA